MQSLINEDGVTIYQFEVVVKIDGAPWRRGGERKLAIWAKDIENAKLDALGSIRRSMPDVHPDSITIVSVGIA